MSRGTFQKTAFAAVATACAFGLLPQLLRQDLEQQAAGVELPAELTEPLTAAPIGTNAPATHSQDVEGAAVFAHFEEWIHRYLEADAANQPLLVEGGVAAATARKGEMLRLIREDPRRAFELTVDDDVRSRLPGQVREQLESVVSGSGDLQQMCATGEAHECSEHHVLKVGTQAYAAHLFGRRAGYRDADGISVHALALDGQLALWDSPVRTTGQSAAGGIEIQYRGRHEVVSTMAEALAFERDAHAKELQVVIRSNAMPEESPSLGEKQFLAILLDFPDLTGALATREETAGFLERISEFYDENSYGKLALKFTIAEGVVRLPFTSDEYVATRGPQGMADDALEIVASELDLDDFAGVLFLFKNIAPDAPGNFYWAGLGGGGRVWINGELRQDVVAHELGHHFGVGHASAWAPSDGNPVSKQGKTITYGDPADVMAMTADGRPGHFNPVFKQRLGWLPDEAVLEVTTSGVYRVFGYDSKNADLSRPVALKLFRGQRDLWISFRQQAFDHLPGYARGATLLRAALDGYKVEILDLNTPGGTPADSPLLPGQVFVDADYGWSIRGLERGASGETEYMDFEITVSPPPRNVLVDYGMTLPAVDEDTFDVDRFSSGAWSSLAVGRDGSVHSGGITPYPALSQLPTGLERAIEVDARSDVFGAKAAVDADGRPFVWGSNMQLVESVPSALQPVRGISLAGDHVALWSIDGTAVLSSSAKAADLGAGTEKLRDVVFVASNFSASFFLHRDGHVTSTMELSAEQQAKLTELVGIAVSDHHLVGLKRDGTVTTISWGEAANAYGEATVPEGLSAVRQIAAANGISAALTERGELVRWGELRQVNELPESRIAAMDAREYHLLLLLNQEAPHFTLHPASAPASPVGGLRLTAFATGASDLDYRWQKRVPGSREWLDLADDADFRGTRSPNLEIPHSLPEYAGTEFRCVATDSSGRSSVSRSSAVFADLVTTVTITGPGEVKAGDSLTLSLSFSGAGDVQWYRDGVAISGADAWTLTLKNADAVAAGEYSAAVTTAYGTFFASTAHRVSVVEIEVQPVAPKPQAAGRLVNLSTRAVSGLGNRLLIAGFVVEPGSTSDFLVCGSGPALDAFGLEGTLEQPRVALFSGDGSALASAETPGSLSAIGSPKNAATASSAGVPDVVLPVLLSSGVYTAHVSGVNEGIGLVEAYSDATDPDARFANLSTRGYVGAGAEVMIAGFAIEGGPLPLLIRAIGQGLQALDVEGTLRDPRITVYRDGEKIFANDTWTEHAEAVAESSLRVGAFDMHASEDAALLVTFEPGAYTVHVESADGNTGVALVEIYDASL